MAHLHKQQYPAGNDAKLEALKRSLAAAKRRKNRLLRDLGERALDVLSEGRVVEPEEPKARSMLKEFGRLQREISQIEDRLYTLQVSPEEEKKVLPPAPGTDRSFPFSR
jgi:hypothetical protein